MGAAAKIIITDDTGTARRNHIAANITALWHRSREGIIAIGLALVQAKKDLDFGEFTAMIDSDLPFGPDNARRFMRIATDPRLSNHATAHVLPGTAGAMDELQKLPDNHFEAALASGAVHPNMTVKDARALVQEIGRQKDAGYREHRPVAASSAPAFEPKDGVAREYLELVWLLAAERRRQGLTQEHLDDLCGMQDGYCGKLEQPNSLYGRRAVHPTFDMWVGGLKVALAVVPQGFRIELVPIA